MAKVGGLWYYFYSSGQMASNTYIGGYKLNSSVLGFSKSFI
ncbi:hypothetical protein [Fredinandcohnia sp. 179-A 10B2 NHS]